MTADADIRAETAITAAMRRWMAGAPLDDSEQAIVMQVLEHNWATQLGRLCIPQCPARSREVAA